MSLSLSEPLSLSEVRGAPAFHLKPPLALALGLRGGDRERDLERDRLRGAESAMTIGWGFDCGR